MKPIAGHDHGHSHGHSHGHGADGHGEEHVVEIGCGVLVLSVFEHGVPPVFRLHGRDAALPAPESVTVETVRPDGVRQVFAMADRDGYLEAVADIPEPHAFTATVNVAGVGHSVAFEERGHAHGAAHRDNNMRAALIHVLADAAVSVLVIVGLLLARAFGWLWMDPLAGIVGACFIASWAYGLVRDTGTILLDMNPDAGMAAKVRSAVEDDGDRLTDLHLWRLRLGHLGAILVFSTARQRGAEFYRQRLTRFGALSHVTIEVDQAA